MSVGDNPEVMIRIGKAGPSTEATAKAAALQKSFDEGVALSKSGDLDGSIAKFNEAIAQAPNCHDCYYNIGYAHSQKKEWDKAEAAYKKATELKPDYAEAWNGLANAYNSQKKLDLALEASANAAKYGGTAAAAAAAPARCTTRASSSGTRASTRRRRRSSRPRPRPIPTYSDAHYRLGMANLNLGDMPGAVAAFEGYLKVRADRAVRRAGEGHPVVDQEVTASSVAANLAAVRGRLEQAARTAGRNPADIRLVAISKTFPPEAVREAFAAGQVDFGENRVQEALQKIRETAELHSRWHLVGHLQTNKARKVVGPFAYVHSVDSLELLTTARRGGGRRNERRRNC